MKLLPALLLLSPPALAQEPTLAQEPVTWITTQLETQIARETFTLTEDGWRSQVDIDVPGQKLSFTCQYREAQDGRHWIAERLGTGGIDVLLADGRVKGKTFPGGPAIDFEVPEHDGTVIFFENLAFGCFYQLSRELISDAGAGTLGAGETIQAVLASASLTIDFTLTAYEHLDDGRWSFAIDFPPGLEMKWTCEPNGLPIRIEVPAQRLVVTREGAVVDPAAGALSAVDRGDWRGILSQPTHAVVIEENLRVPMRDGKTLAADVHRPDAEGKFPTVLIRTPYDRRNEALANGARFARRGYAVVAQDVRGRFDSEGTFFPLIHEERDGSDTLDWIAEQPWSDGNVGMIGGSYVGWVQWYAAKSGNPHLKAIIPQVSPPDPDQNIPYEGGVFLLSSAWWAGVLTHMAAGGAGIPDKDYDAIMATLPLNDLDEAFGSSEPFLDAWLAHPPDDEAYWGPQRYQPYLKDMSVPALHLTGWYDGDQPGALQNFPVMQRHAKTQEARDGQFLIVGPWGHGFNVMRRLGDIDFGDEALVDLTAVEVRFFDRYLKGIDNGVERDKPVWVFTMGENRWHNEETWPIPGTAFTPLYLGSDGDARRRDGDGHAHLAAGGGSEESSAIEYDPASFPDFMVDWTDTTGQAATRDLDTLEDRADNLEFLSAPLAAPVELTGPFEAVLYVTSSAADADFTVSVVRVDARGRARVVAGGIQRMRYRNGPDEPVPPGEVAKLTVDLWACGLRFDKGDRIRVEIACSGFPGYARNLGTLDPIGAATELVTATNRVLHTQEFPSHVILPVVPRPDAPGLRFER